MLVPPRKNEEQLHIKIEHGEPIKIYVTDIKGHQVRIVFDALRSCSILREELVQNTARDHNLT